MSFFDRMNAIQSRMQEIQSKFGSTPIGQLQKPTGVAGSLPMGQMLPPQVYGGPSFQQIFADRMNTMSHSSLPSSNVTATNWKAADFEGIINEAAQKYGVDKALIKGVIQQESGFNPSATSSCGAMGMMQLMPDTARELGCSNAYDPRENIMAGVKYLKQNLDRFGGDVSKALAAYNAGPGAVMQHGGIPPYKETQNYVANILALYRQYSFGG